MWATVLLIIAILFARQPAMAAFSGRFSLGVGEEYNDNIFLVKDKEHDFITWISPTFSLLYAHPGETAPAFQARFTPKGQIFARHGELSNFGKNLLFDMGYTYRYSPRLTFQFADTLQRLDATRTGLAGEGSLNQPFLPTLLIGGNQSLPSSRRLGDFLSTGETLTNNFSAQGSFAYGPNITFGGGYSAGYTNFLDEGGSEISHSLTARGVYKWREQHNLHAGYTLNIISSREDGDSVVHNFDIGDDYFSSRRIELTPTLTLSFSTGVSFNLGNDGPRVANNTNLALIKVWEASALTVGARKGLTESFGVSGISDTTTVFASFTTRLTERLTGLAGVDYSLYDTDDVNFNTFSAHVGLQYSITNWLCSAMGYRHRWVDAGSGANRTEFLERGTVHGNAAFIGISAHFDVWPVPGLAKSACPVFAPPVVQPAQ